MFLLASCTATAATKTTIAINPKQYSNTKSQQQLSAADLFKSGYANMKNENYKLAISIFNKALYTGELSETGKVMCLWYILEASIHARLSINVDNVHSFITIGNDLINNPANDNEKEFIGFFMLKQKIDFANATIENAWKNRQVETKSETTH